MSGVPRDPWFKLANRTPARIGLGRVGASLPTREVLAFALAHAQARDAVHTVLDRGQLAAELAAMGLASIEVESQAVDRQLYLRRPDLGRRLSAASQEQLQRLGGGSCDLALIIGDGLSAAAAQAHAPALVSAFLPYAAALGVKLAAVALAAGARVALGDEIGGALDAKLAIVLIGERPGLSAPDSLGVYLTYQPKPGRHDAERNCISNIRPEGLAPAAAARKLAWLVEAALARQLTGVMLKDGSADALAGAEPEPLLLGP